MSDTIAIIGRGPSGVIALHDILVLPEEEKNAGQPHPVDIFWYDAQAQLGAPPRLCNESFSSTDTQRINSYGASFSVQQKDNRWIYIFLN